MQKAQVPAQPAKSQKADAAAWQSASELGSGFAIDNRPEAVAQRALADAMVTSPYILRQRAQFDSLVSAPGKGSVQRTIGTAGINGGANLVDAAGVADGYGFNAVATARFMEWVRDGTPRNYASREEMIATVVESAEGGHTLGRHGPAVTGAQLGSRLFRGIAPDNALSPAPGSSSKFVSHAAVVSTRQTAATALRAAIMATQQLVLNWKGAVFTPGALQATRDAANAALGVENVENVRLQGVLNAFGGSPQGVQMAAVRVEIGRLEEVLRDQTGELDAVNLSLDGGIDIMSGDVTNPATGADAVALRIQKADWEGRIANTEQALVAARAELVVLQQAQTAYRGLHLPPQQQQQARVTAAEDVRDTALDQVANPGKNLARYLRAQGGMKLVVANNPGAGFPLAAGATLGDQYSIVVDNAADIGTGVTADDADAVTLTAVFQAAAVDPAAAIPVPKNEVAIRAALVVLDLRQELDLFAAYLADAGNLANIKTRGENGGKVYKAAANAGNLRKSITNFGIEGSKVLFGAADAPAAIDAGPWKAIQHFPARNDAAVGVVAD